MRNEVNNCQKLLWTNLQSKTQRVGFFTQTYKTKYNADEAIPFSRLQKSQHKYIVPKSFSGLETFPNN